MNYHAMKKADLIARIQELETQSPQTATNLQVTACHIYPFDASPTGSLKALATVINSETYQRLQDDTKKPSQHPQRRLPMAKKPIFLRPTKKRVTGR